MAISLWNGDIRHKPDQWLKVISLEITESSKGSGYSEMSKTQRIKKGGERGS